MATRKSEDNERLIDRDLTVLARDGKLPPAHGVDSAVAEVLGLLTQAKLYPSVLRFVHSRVEDAATRFLVQAVRDRDRGLAVRPPLIVHGGGPGGYSAEVAALMDAPVAERVPPGEE